MKGGKDSDAPGSLGALNRVLPAACVVSSPKPPGKRKDLPHPAPTSPNNTPFVFGQIAYNQEARY